LFQRLEIVDFSADKLQQPASGGRSLRVSRMRSNSSTKRTPTPTRGPGLSIWHDVLDMGGCRRVKSNHFDGRDTAGCADTRSAGNTRSARA
jgi:hypothetical protein